MSRLPIIMRLDGSGRHSTLQSGHLPSTDQLISIDWPVGLGSQARILPTNVLTIQNALPTSRPPPLRAYPCFPDHHAHPCSPHPVVAQWSMDITVKRISEELYQNFRKLSSRNGRSLNSEIIAAMHAAGAGLESFRICSSSNTRPNQNNDPTTPSPIRHQITADAQSFMTTFPGMIVTLDRIHTENGLAIFAWTLTVTYTANGNPVRISGHEAWQLAPDGHFDAADYARQISAA